MRSPGRIAAACLAIVLIGCGRGGTPTPVPSPTVATAHIDVGGLTRDYLVATPPDVASRHPLPLLLALHGATQTMNDAESIGGFDDIAVDPGAVVVYPDGYGKTWNGGGCCAPATTDGIDDVGFLTALLDRLEEDYPVDPGRVFLLGASNGGEMAYRMACELSDRIAAVAGVITTLLVDCNPTTPVSVIDIHGTADMMIPYNGGTRLCNVTCPSVADTMERWRQADGCTGEPTVTPEGNLVTTDFTACAGGVEVTFIKVTGMGHQWSEFNPDDRAVTWAFLSTHARSA